MSAQRHRAGWAAQYYSLGVFWGEVLQIGPGGDTSPQPYFSATLAGVPLLHEFPPMKNGESPNWLLVSSHGPCWLRFGDASVVVSAATGLYMPKGNAVFNVTGFTHISRLGDIPLLNSSLAALENQ